MLNDRANAGGSPAAVGAAAESDAGSRERLIHAAARLFAEHGFDGVSVRQIAAEAEANSALVGYYFRGKDGLLSEVYRWLSEPLTRERTRLLDACLAGGRAPRLEEVIEAFVRPALDATRGPEGKLFTRLRAMLAGRRSDLLDRLVAESFDRSTLRFVEVLHGCLPRLSRDEVFWRFHFLLGAIYYTAAGPHRVKVLSGGGCDPSDAAAALPQLVRHAAAGFRAPSGAATQAPSSGGTRRATKPLGAKGDAEGGKKAGATATRASPRPAAARRGKGR